MKCDSYDNLRANLAEFITDDDKLDILMDKAWNLTDHVFNAIVSQLNQGLNGTWDEFCHSEEGQEYLSILGLVPEIGWIFEWMYKRMGENNIPYIKEALDGSE